MKRRIFCLVLSVLVLFVSASAAGTITLPAIGSAEEIISAASVYCNKWNELIGGAFGFDMSFDPNNIRKVEERHYDLAGNQVVTFDFDGIQADVDDDLMVHSFDIRIQATTSQEQYASTARIFGLINALGYDYPHSDAEMTARYMDLLTAYTEFMEANKEKLAAEEIVYWTVTTDKGDLEFQFIAIGGRLRMMYDLMYLED